MKRTWYEEAVIYGLDISKFYDSDGDGIGDIRGLITKLDYLVELGINTIWLLPFYPTENRDNGYDITNHIDVDPAVGTLADFRTLMYACKTKGLRIIVDLVMHHTSLKHPWFIASSMQGESKYRGYYLWRDQIVPDVQTENAFPTVEDGVWTYEENAHAYYRHQFYSHEPDLNIADKHVRHEIFNIIDYWLALGVDGFRIDAAAFVLNQKGMLTPSESASEFFEAIREHITGLNPEAVMIGEADVEFQEISDYFGTKTKLQMLNNFLINNQFFLSLATAKAEPIVKCIGEQQELKAKGTWVNFIRNLDELNLMHLEPEDQKQVMKLYAPEQNMTIFDRGIRRRLPTMLGGNMRQIKMAYSLMFALPGVPMFMYGDEIGMGDDLARPGRNSVRLPMQWTDEHNAGFSSTTENIANQDSEYGYEVLNVEGQRRRSGTLWSFMHDLIETNTTLHQILSGMHEVIDCGNPHVVGLYYEHDGESLLVLHNLSARKQAVTLPKAKTPRRDSVVFGEALRDGSLSGYGYGWFRL